MIVKALLLAMLLSLGNSQTNEDLKIFIAKNNATDGKRLVGAYLPVSQEHTSEETIRGNCGYNGTHFNSSHAVEGKCLLLTCNHRHGEVNIFGCSEPRPSCERLQNINKTYPECCETKCKDTKSPCITKRGQKLEDGESRNLTRPCRLVKCVGGEMVTLKKCPKTKGTGCTIERPLGMDKLPYPTCCGVRTCTGKGDKRKKRS